MAPITPRSGSALPLLAVLAALLPAPVPAAPMTAPHVEAELVAERMALAPGANWVALRLAPAPGWHTYWREPGDVGLPTTLQWTLPAGYTAGPIQWPQPEVFRAGDEVSYGYGRETLHLVVVDVPASAAGQDAALTAEARWLVCKDLCIPGRATLTLNLPVRDAPGAPSPWAAAFAATRSRLPQPGDANPLDASLPAFSGPSPAAAPLLLVLGFALLGGLILNLMPCVFPVLSIKAVSVLEARGRDGGHARAHALAYTAGVVLSCVAAALAILGMRASGELLGWGFQLQSPVFVTVLLYLVFAMGLSLSGLVQFGTRLMGVGQSLTVRDGYAGSFFTGVLAVVVASPCTAPFMGSALGYALTQPAPIALLVFAVLGLGLALPFLLIAFVPRAAALLPRPGAWMETFKHAMAFPMYLTAVWLIWVLGRQAGIDVVAIALAGLVLLAAALWLRQRGSGVARGIGYAALLAALAAPLHPAFRSETAAGARAGADAAIDWVPWSEARLAALRAEGRSVLVDFTADWCITCKLNERVLESDTVRRALAQRRVVLMQGDWTRNDPAIGRVLQRFNRPGVPLGLLYAPRGEPEVLPQLLTSGNVLEALERLPAPGAFYGVNPASPFPYSQVRDSPS